MNEDYKNSPYPKRVVAFVDILGYKKIIDENRFYDVHRILNKIKRELTTNILTSDSDWQFSMFSDCFVISFSPDEKQIQHQFFELFDKLESIKFSIGILNISLRGGISYGEFWHRDGECLGPAFNQAYLLESKKAIYPRIIIDDVIFKTFSLTEAPTVMNLIDKHIDKYYFISSLKKTPKYEANNKNNIETFVLGKLENEKKNIEKGIKEIPEKYIWLLSYYNKKCNEKMIEIPEFFNKIQPLIISI